MTTRDNKNDGFCHTLFIVFQWFNTYVTIVTKKREKLCFCLIISPKSCKFVAKKGQKGSTYILSNYNSSFESYFKQRMIPIKQMFFCINAVSGNE